MVSYEKTKVSYEKTKVSQKKTKVLMKTSCFLRRLIFSKIKDLRLSLPS